MAKRRSKAFSGSNRPDAHDGTTDLPSRAEATLGGVEEKIVDFAEDLGRILGTTQKKASDWMRQRQTVIRQLEGIRATAEGLLGQLGSVTAVVVRRGRKPGRPVQSAQGNELASEPARKGRPPRAAAKRNRPAMSAAQRKAVSERMRKYWAQRRRVAKAG
jgi:hypothetical protein